MTTKFDAIIIGTGQAGPGLAGRLASAGMRVAVVERARFGGTCVNTGCIPTKAMVQSPSSSTKSRPAKPPSPPNLAKGSNAGSGAWPTALSIKVRHASNHLR